MNAYPYFPPDGSCRCSRSRCGQYQTSSSSGVCSWIPSRVNNGLFGGVLGQSPCTAAVELTNPDYWRTPYPATTFHGRDIFAPVGATLASGIL